MKSLLLLISFCVSGTSLLAQKTIYQELHLTPGGCKLSPFAGGMETMMEEGIADPPRESMTEKGYSGPSLLSIINESRPFFKQISLNTTATSPATIMSNGNVVFKENGLYGLKTNTGKIIIPPSFQYIIPDGKKGFVGYKAAVCNYYDLNGKKYFNTDYYFIQPTTVNTFIIQTAKGFGVVDALKKTVIKPSFYKISTFSDKGLFYYKIYTTADKTFFLSQQAKDTIRVSAPYRDPTILSGGYWMTDGGLVDIKANKNIICEPRFYTEVRSVENQLASVSNDGKKYLINFKGTLLGKGSFKEIYSFEKNGLSIAAIESPSDKGMFNRGLWGVIDNKGNWVIKPVYSWLNFINDDLLVGGYQREGGAIISKTGKVLTDFKYSNIRNVNDSTLLGVVETKDTILSDLIRIRDLKIIRKDLPYRSISKNELCTSENYIAELKKGECWLNEKLEPILPRVYSRLFYGPNRTSIIASNFFSDRSGSESQLFDCNGVMKTFTIDGKIYDTFDSYTYLDKDLGHVLLTDGTGYFVLPDGHTVANNSHWQDIKKGNNKDLFITMIYGGKFGIVNSAGTTVIPPVFEYISPYDPETALATYNFDDRQKGYLTAEGELLFDMLYEDCQWLGKGLFKVKKHNDWGVVNRENKIIVPIENESVELNGGIILAGDVSNPKKYTLAGEHIN
jgi:hypothetical protein